MSALPFDGVEHLVKVVDQFDADHPEDQEELPTLAQYLALLDRLIANARAYRSRLEQELAKRADTKLVEFPGGTAEVKGGTRRKAWDSPMILSLVVDRAMEQGVHPRDAIQETAGIGYWRTGALRKFDIDPDQWSEVTYGPPTVVIRANEEKAEE